jgi:uncharacterized peroxidase-related enzyme
LTGSGDLSRALAIDYRTAVVSVADRAMLDYAVLLTRSPAAVEPKSIHALRDAGFEDTAILDICQVVSYYNYVNRLADGLGVELEDSWSDEALTLTRKEFEQARSTHRPTPPGEDT